MLNANNMGTGYTTQLILMAHQISACLEHQDVGESVKPFLSGSANSSHFDARIVLDKLEQVADAVHILSLL